MRRRDILLAWTKSLLIPAFAGFFAWFMLQAHSELTFQHSLAFSLVTASGAGLARLVYLAEIERRAACKANHDLLEIFHSTLRCLAAAIDARDCHERDHVSAVEFVACQIAQEMGLEPDEIEGIRTAALLLDVGTLGVPENILLRPTRPTVEEFSTIHNHPIVGAQILEDVSFPWPIQKMIRSHHERWDGSGYPDRLRDKEIPVGSRILAIADVYGALVSNRAYRSGWTHNQAVAHIRRMSGSHFDPNLVKIFLRIAYRIPLAGFGNGAPANERLFSPIARANQQFVALWEISQTANTSLELKDTLSAVARKITETMNCDGCAIFLKDNEKNLLVCQAAHPDEATPLIGSWTTQGQPGTGTVARDGRPVIVRPSRDILKTADGEALEVDFEWVAIAPMIADLQFIGTINLYRTGKDFSIEELDLLDALARHAAVPVANASLYEATRQDAERDPLTGLPNVRFFCSRVEKEFARASRLGREFSLVAVDLDNFKGVNDTLGHQAGDALLRDISQVFAGAVREYDTVVRYGGDEFVIVLPEASADQAQETIARLSRTVRAFVFRLAGLQSIGFGASFGCATFPKDGSDVKTLLAVADARMYESKRGAHASRHVA